MVQVDLITGFLGAGKTTFLRRYVRYLVAQGHNVCILENDFGAVNVDAMLVQDLLGPNCDLETISGGCDCDTHQRRMRTKLIAMAMRGFDRVVVEPSGIFDVDEFFDVLRDDPHLGIDYSSLSKVVVYFKFDIILSFFLGNVKLIRNCSF